MASFDINEKEINEKINEENLSEFVRAFPSLYDKKQLFSKTETRKIMPGKKLPKTLRQKSGGNCIHKSKKNI